MSAFEKFVPHPEIALRQDLFDPAVHKAVYQYDYASIFRDISEGRLDQRSAFREMVKTDRFFIAYFVAGWEDGKSSGNKPFVVNQCKMLDEGADSGTVDIWSREHGKALALDTPVPVPGGWKTHGDLEAGDKVFGPDGSLRTVVGRTDIFQNEDCYRVDFDGADSIVCSGNHLWDVWRKSRRRVSGTANKRHYRDHLLLTASELSNSEHVDDNRYSVIVASSPDLSDPVLLIDPYLLGAWLGDGNSGAAAITVHVDDLPYMVEKLSDVGHKYRVIESGNLNSVLVRIDERDLDYCTRGHHRPTEGIYKNGCMKCRKQYHRWEKYGETTDEVIVDTFAWRLRKLNVLCDNAGVKKGARKHIPAEYLRSSTGSRLSLLRGLMDTDGYVDTRGTAQFCNTNAELSENVFELCSSLGFKPKIAKRKAMLDGREISDVYYIQFQAGIELCPFSLPRKVARCRPRMSRSQMHFIRAVVPVSSVPTSCITVDHPDGMYVAGRDWVPTHNSSCITIAGTVKRLVNDPECTTVIFSFRKSSAEKFLDSIKKIFEDELMIFLFPDLLYAKPETQSPKWSVQDGIRIKRKNQIKREHSVESYGLVDGSPIGGHYDHRIYDDIEIESMARNPEQLDQCYESLMMSRALGREGGTEQIIGTYYSHCGVLVKLGDKKGIDGNNMYRLRVFPATSDGTINGNPVLFSQEYLDDKKTDSGFSTQYLCNPTPTHELRLYGDRFKRIMKEDLPEERAKIIVIDPAGDKEVQTGRKNDSWAMLCLSVEMTKDDLGNRNVYLEDAIVGEFGLSNAVDAACTLYMRNGRISIIGIEKVGQSTHYDHILQGLKARGVYVSIKKKGSQYGNMVLLATAGRDKNYRIESALSWPLNNGKLHIVDTVDDDVVDKLMLECERFPFFHVDMLDAMSYVYDVLADPTIILTAYRQIAAPVMKPERRVCGYSPMCA